MSEAGSARQPPPSVLRVGGAAPYDVVVGHHVLDRVTEVLGDQPQRVALLFAGDLGEQAQSLAEQLVEHYDVLALGLPGGETAKTSSVLADCWEALGERGFTRSDAVVTLGGGATTDLGGFVAASWLRGVRVVHVPTTLLAMVDAAVGGKTGINTSAGKNLVGAFHEPAGVVCDLALLETLPAPELVAGLGEVVKCGFIADPEILHILEATDPAELAPRSQVLRELIERAIAVKIDVVVADLTETGARADQPGHPGREALNYGHTLAHALEKAEDYTLRHGEAVSIGCVYVAEVARRAGLLAADVAERHRKVLARVGLPVAYAGVATFEDLLATMRVDKKSRGDQLRLVVLHDLAAPRILAGPSEGDLRAAFETVQSRDPLAEGQP